MKKRKVVLVGKHHLWGESLEFLLSNAQDIELVGWWDFDETFRVRLKEQVPDIIVIVDDDLLSGDTACLTTEIMEVLPDSTVLHVTPSNSDLKIFTAQTIPARQTELIDAILNLRPRRAATNSSKPQMEEEE